jgi:hypothetical protein
MINQFYQPPQPRFLSDSLEEEEERPVGRFDVPVDTAVQPPYVPREEEYTAPETGIRAEYPKIQPSLAETGGVSDEELFAKIDIPPPSPVPYDPKITGMYNESVDRLAQAEAAVPETYRKKKDKWYHNLGRGLLNGVSNFVDQGGIPLLFQQGSTGAGMAVGSMLGGGVSNVLSPYADERLAIRRDQMEARAKLAEAQKFRDADIERVRYGDQANTERYRRMIELANVNQKITGLQTGLLKAREKNEITLTGQRIKAITDQIKLMPSFDPTEHEALMQQFTQLTGGGILTKRKAAVDDVKLIPDGKTGKVWKEITFKDGTIEKGYIKDGNENIIAVPPVVQAAIETQKGYMATTIKKEEGANERTRLNITSRENLIRLQQEFAKPDFMRKALATEMALAAENGEDWTPEMYKEFYDFYSQLYENKIDPEKVRSPRAFKDNPSEWRKYVPQPAKLPAGGKDKSLQTATPQTHVVKPY